MLNPPNRSGSVQSCRKNVPNIVGLFFCKGLFLQKLRIPYHGRKGVVEIVGYSTRQLAHTFQFLRLPEMFLGFFQGLFSPLTVRYVVR